LNQLNANQGVMMTNRPLRDVEMQLNTFIDSWKVFWTTNAEFVGTLKFLQIGDPPQKLLAKLENLKRRHRFTAAQHQRAQRIKAAIVSVSRSPVRSKIEDTSRCGMTTK
jgi:hypothetical protein